MTEIGISVYDAVGRAVEHFKPLIEFEEMDFGVEI